jgi:hypothetical protein
VCRAAGGELEQVRTLLCHASVQTTERIAVSQSIDFIAKNMLAKG